MIAAASCFENCSRAVPSTGPLASARRSHVDQNLDPPRPAASDRPTAGPRLAGSVCQQPGQLQNWVLGRQSLSCSSRRTLRSRPARPPLEMCESGSRRQRGVGDSCRSDATALDLAAGRVSRLDVNLGPIAVVQRINRSPRCPAPSSAHVDPSFPSTVRVGGVATP